MQPEHEVLISDWFRRVRENQFIHYACGNHFSRLNYWLGIPTIVLTTAVGTAIFATLETETTGALRIGIGLISILASVLAALHTFLGFSERAEKHRLTAAGYAAVRRQLEFLKTFPVGDEKELSQRLESTKQEIDNLAKSSPEVPGKIWNNKVTELKGREHRRIFHLPARSDQ
ncbi:MAG: SLATT domain-containing protein [Nitrososphaera sp.]|nr:SLATT domain-containing protein [Nitrososphaera sp.]